MKTFIFTLILRAALGIIVLVALVAIAACTTVQPVLTCVSAPAMPGDVVEAVANIFASLPIVPSAPYVSELAPLVAKFGECVVRAAIAQNAGEKTAAVAVGEASGRAQRERAWLAAHPVKVTP
jgi:hypothetical protein